MREAYDIAALMRRLGLSGRQLGMAVGCSYRTIKLWKQGRRPQRVYLARLKALEAHRYHPANPDREMLPRPACRKLNLSPPDEDDGRRLYGSAGSLGVLSRGL